MVARLICQQCGKPVQGSYVNALGAVWHAEHFVCVACKLPIDSTSFNVHDNKPYHPACYIERVAPRCAHCGKPLTGRYVQSDGKSYHAECYRNFVVPRCAYCNEPLMEEYMVDHWGAKYCKKHQQEYPACEFCGRLIPPAQQERGMDKLNSTCCPVCRSRAIEITEQVKTAFAEVKRWVGSQGLSYNNLPLSIRLCDRDYLAKFARARGQPHMLGVTMSTAHTLNGKETRTDIEGIAVLKGLPTPLFDGVVAHELGHVWLIVHDVKGLPSWAEEGFCELLSYRYYTRLSTLESRYHSESIEKNPDPVYGEGFRRVQAIADRVGFANLLATLQKSGRLPA
jgi:LIM domain/Protein DA1